MHIAVHRAVVLHLCRPVLPVVVEVQGMAACDRHVHDVIAAEHIIRHRAAALLLHPQAVGVVLVLHRAAAVGLAGQLPARLPGIGPPGVGGDVADGVADHGIGDTVDHAGGQLVLPVGVPILIVLRMVGRAQGAGGIAVALFVLDITAAVILISPALVIGLIVHPDKLAQRVVDIADGLPFVDSGCNIAVVIVGIAVI
jgi:hypothetical protein